MVQLSFLLALLLAALANANVEKLIFISPPPSPPQNPDLSSLHVLAPDQTTIRTQFLSKFGPISTSPDTVPSETWFLLSKLKPNHRYEIRICWPATQPTAFELELFPEDEIMQKQELLESIAKLQRPSKQTALPEHVTEQEESRLFFRVKAVADYFTTNQTIMSSGLIVDADIILDEYIWGLAPRSLTSTGVYLLAAAIVAVFIARKVLNYLVSVASVDRETEEAKGKKTL